MILANQKAGIPDWLGYHLHHNRHLWTIPRHLEEDHLYLDKFYRFWPKSRDQACLPQHSNCKIEAFLFSHSEPVDKRIVKLEVYLDAIDVFLHAEESPVVFPWDRT